MTGNSGSTGTHLTVAFHITFHQLEMSGIEPGTFCMPSPNIKGAGSLTGFHSGNPGGKLPLPSQRCMNQNPTPALTVLGGGAPATDMTVGKEADGHGEVGQAGRLHEVVKVHGAVELDQRNVIGLGAGIVILVEDNFAH